ncbi:MAG: Cytochrome c biogenesis protein transmembrane region [Candidatus Saccharibacteria bacterium GW2011_GWA2_46_10]|nr:MAG: Cytochrome c biogenesis protein transmembrane region [Candidatus Saccharibacteria bacterium GW2011_GWA2_46_10]
MELVAVYSLGILTIFLPLGLGIAALGSFFADNHSLFFTIGGVFMLLMGLAMLLGKSFMLPVHVHPRLQKYDFGSIYVLGVFSGIATTCCAPVLAGVLALSVLPGSIWLGSLYALTFVIGMVIPLFIMAVLIDKTEVIKKFESLKRRVNYSLFGRKISISLSHLVSGIVFSAFGLFILIYERLNPDVFGTGYQLQINLLAARLTRFIDRLTSSIPDVAWAILFIALFLLIGWKAYQQATKEEVK